jgi:3-hydroxyacyl-CoA dehydrogenase / enoyl-CoA hydratase / 3-hydroxybutyryl-CoA epimerase / enoyl-CoA isomerase
MALIYGIGFPPFRGGALRYIDAMGVGAFVKLADGLAEELGPLYAPTDKLRKPWPPPASASTAPGPGLSPPPRTGVTER